MIEMKGAYEVRPTKVGTRVRRVSPIGYEVVHRRTGEVEDKSGWVTEEVPVDASRFVKIYDPVTLVGLHPQGYKVFLYLLWNLRYDGTVSVCMKDAMKFIDVKTAKSVNNGLKELAELDIIRRCAIDTYYMNPNIAGRGKRKINQE